MGFIIIAPFAILAGWSIFAISRWLKRGGYGQKWWRAFALLGCAGLGLGVWLTFFLQYNVANKRIQGFPIPLQILSREKPADPWVKSALPTSIYLGGIVTNLLCGAALCLAPIAAAAFFRENRIQHGTQGNPPPNNPS